VNGNLWKDVPGQEFIFRAHDSLNPLWRFEPQNSILVAAKTFKLPRSVRELVLNDFYVFIT